MFGTGAASFGRPKVWSTVPPARVPNIGTTHCAIEQDFLVAMDKLSISLDESLAQTVREAAAAEDLSVSAWLSAAAQDRIRNRLLRVALDSDDREFGALSETDVNALVAHARARAIVTGPRVGAA
jgi:hypothetical protein